MTARRSLHRRWGCCHFGLRLLLLFITVAAVVLALGAHRAAKFRRVSAAIRAAGGNHSDASSTFGRYNPLEVLFGNAIRREVRSLYAEHTTVDDAWLAKWLPELPHLESLHLEDTRITDLSLSHIAELEYLKNVCLSGTR